MNNETTAPTVIIKLRTKNTYATRKELKNFTENSVFAIVLAPQILSHTSSPLIWNQHGIDKARTNPNSPAIVKMKSSFLNAAAKINGGTAASKREIERDPDVPYRDVIFLGIDDR